MELKLCKLLVLTIILSIISLSCNQQKTKWQGSIEKVNGVTVVKNPIEPMYGEDALELEEDLTIGVAEGEEEYMFTEIYDIDVDERGNIYVADRIRAHIRVFDENGIHLKTIGRKGQGPGEMQMPIYVQITNRDEVLVHDYLGQRLSYFSLDGNFLRQKSTAITRSPFIPIRMDSQGNLIVLAAFGPAPMGGKQLRLYDSNLEFVLMIAKEERDMRRTFDIGKPTWFCDVSPQGRIIWGDSKKFVLSVLNSDSTLIKKIFKEYKPVEITADDKDRYRKQYAVPLERGLKILFRNHFPAFSEINIDDEERIFVKTYEKARDGEGFFNHDVFDAEGKYIAKVPIRVNQNSVWKNNKLYTIEEDEEGYQVVKRYKVTWKI
jgi:hypothetical protein